MKKIVLTLFLLSSAFVYSQGNITYKFIENKGQWNNKVKFKTALEGGNLYLESNSLTFDFYNEKELDVYFHAHNNHLPKAPLSRLNCHSYKVEFIGGNTSSIEKKLATKEYYNYFLGSDKSKWAKNVYGFYQIQYKEIYPNIDLKIYNHNQSLKYDFVVKPNSNSELIQLNYKGVKNLKLKNGKLQITTSVNQVVEEKPYAFQIINGDKVEVACRYSLEGTVLKFVFPQGYDKSLELVIDPTLIFSTFSGSTSNNFGYTATFDKGGFLYSGSTVFGSSYPITTGAYDISFNGGIVDVAVSKYDTSGTFMVYSTFLGGSSDELPHSMIVNSKNELFVYGTTSSLNFPYSTGCYDSTFNGGTALNLSTGLGVNFINGSDIFIVKLSELGDSLLGGTLIGGSGNDGLNSTSVNNLKYNYADEVRGEIEIDKNNNIYIVTCTKSTDFPVSVRSFQTSHGGGDLDGCIFKMDDKLTTLIWSSYLGGSGDDAGYSVALDSKGNAYAAGGTNSTDFIVSDSAIDTSYTGVRADGFITKINVTGTSILNSTYLGSDVYDQIYFVELDRSDSVYVFGQTEKMDSSFIKNATYFTFNSGQFITKLSPELDTIEWSTVFGSGGGGPNISPTAFLVDVCNKIYLSGWGGSTNTLFANNNAISTRGMTVTSGAYQSTTDGNDFYLMVLESDASNIVYGSYYGGNLSSEHVDGGTSRFDRNGRMYQSVCAGCGGNSDFPIKPSPGAVSSTNGSNCNNAVFKFDFNLPITLADFNVNPVSCIQDTVHFFNNSLRGTSFLWDFGDGSTSVLPNPSHKYTTSGFYIVKLTVSDTSACNKTDFITRQITILSDSSWHLPNDSICENSFKQIGILPSSDPSITYKWFPSVGLSDTSISNPIASPTITTDYSLLVSNGFCTDTLLFKIVVKSYQINIPNDTVLCYPGTPLTIKGSSNGTTPYFHWSTNSMFTDRLNSTNTDSVLTVSPLTTTTYYLRVGSGSCFVEDSIVVEVFSSQFLIDGKTNICLGDSVYLKVVTTSMDSLIYDWSPDMEIIRGDSTNNIVSKPNSNTTYSVIIANSKGCSYTIAKTVNVSPLVLGSAIATASKTEIYAGESVQLSVKPNGYSYSWSPASSLNNPSIQNPIATPKKSTVYYVTVYDTICDLTARVEIRVKEIVCGPPDLFVPNSFTPNGDGENDILYVRGNNITKITFRVFHRWGEKVFETNNQSEGWDGTFKGKKCDPAVFVYYLDVECRGGDTYQEKGNISLIR